MINDYPKTKKSQLYAFIACLLEWLLTIQRPKSATGASGVVEVIEKVCRDVILENVGLARHQVEKFKVFFMRWLSEPQRRGTCL